MFEDSGYKERWDQAFITLKTNHVLENAESKRINFPQTSKELSISSWKKKKVFMHQFLLDFVVFLV